jgi:hypothetical protein
LIGLDSTTGKAVKSYHPYSEGIFSQARQCLIDAEPAGFCCCAIDDQSIGGGDHFKIKMLPRYGVVRYLLFLAVFKSAFVLIGNILVMLSMDLSGHWNLSECPLAVCSLLESCHGRQASSFVLSG